MLKITPGEVRALKPCDCLTEYDVKQLLESSFSSEGYRVDVEWGTAILVIYPHVRIFIPINTMKKLCEWLLKDQPLPDLSGKCAELKISDV